MKKYYAKPTSMETFDYTIYYDEYQAIDDKFWAGGNHNFGDINRQFREHLVSDISDADYSMSNYFDPDITEEKNAEMMFDSLYYYFPEARGQEAEYIEVIQEFVSCNTSDEDRVLCEMLELIHGEPFMHGTIQGNSQGDWMDFICPAKLKNRIPYIEAVLFATGMEYEISEDKLDSAEEFETASTFYDFTECWREDDVKAWIADMLNCSKDEVEILEGDN